MKMMIMSTAFLLSFILMFMANGCTPKPTSPETERDIKTAQPNITIYDPGDPPFSLNSNLIFIPGGTFLMGRTRESGLNQYADELPIHQVTLEPFYIGRFEVRQSNWKAVMHSNPSIFTGNVNCPVEMVSWYATLVYCNKLSMRENLTPAYSINGITDPDDWGPIPTVSSAVWDAVICNWSADGYRLPTEAEWECAARGAVSVPDYIFAGSDSINEVAWYQANSEFATHQVGTKLANALGLCDMSGNVQEWCWDWYDAAYYSNSPGFYPTGPETGVVRVVRGGSWQQGATACRIAFRNWGTPEKDTPKVANNRLGFRVVRTFVDD